MGLFISLVRALVPGHIRLYPQKILNAQKMLWYKWFAGGNRDRSTTFGKIYDNRQWGKEATNDLFSGPGSLPEYTVEYENYVTEFIKAHAISSVLDIGCGDFQVSRRILSNSDRKIKYIGIDVAESVIERNNRLFGSDDISFFHMDAVEEELPQAELVLIREVLQHLSIQSINAILHKLRKYRYVLVTEHCSLHPKKINIDIPDGKYARVDFQSGTLLDRAPFHVKGGEVLTIRLSDNATYIRSFLITAGQDVVWP